MIVKCPSCASKFRVPEERVRSEGVMVRCSRCKKVFKVRRSSENETTVRSKSPLAQPPPPGPPIALADTEATRVVRDPLGEAGIPDDISAITDSSHLRDDAFSFDLARDIPDPLLDIPFSPDPLVEHGRHVESGGAADMPTPMPGLRTNAATDYPAGSAAAAGPVPDEDDLSSLLSLAFPKEASAEPGEGDLAVLEAQQMTIAPMDSAMALGAASSMDGLVAFDAEGHQFDPLADSSARGSKPSFTPPVEDDGDMDFDLGLTTPGQEPEAARDGAPMRSSQRLATQPTPLPPEAALADMRLDDFPEPTAAEGIVVGPRGPSGALPAATAAGPVALGPLLTGLSSALGVIVLLLGFLLFLAARNDWLLDLGEMDQMLGVAFQGATYQPRHTRTVRVVEIEGRIVEEPVEPEPTRIEPRAPRLPLRVQNLEQRLYETGQDVHLMVVEGDLVNASDRQQRRIFVRARLLSGEAALSDLIVPVGRNLTQEELERVVTPESLQTIYDRIAQEAVELVLNPNQRSRFTAVFARPDGPWNADALGYTVDVVEAQAAEGTGDWRREIFDPARLETTPQ